MRHLIILSIILITNSGCSFIKHKPKAVEPPATVVLPQKRFLQSSKILDEKKLKDGGKILVVPFTPGTNITADDESDRVALMIVKGLADSLLSQSSHFQVLDAANSPEADLVLQGRILDMNEAGRLKKVALRNNRKSLAVEGSIIDPKSGETVFHFTDTVESRDKKKTFSELGAVIGQNIGNFLTISTN